MEGSTSQLPPPPPNFPYFSLTFHSTNEIKLIDCDEQCLALIRKVVGDNWPSGIQSQFFDNGAFNIKLSGNPFSKGSGKGQALDSKLMCCALLTALHSMGWELCVSSDLSRTTDLTTWFFQRNPSLIGKQLPSDGGIVCLSLSSQDKLQLVNAPGYLQKELLQCVGPLLQNHEVHGNDLEVKMKGHPWSNDNFEEGVTARQLLLDVIKKFDSFNYRFHGTANLKGTTDCIFFEQDRNYAGVGTRFCMLSLNCSDRIGLIYCPQEVVDTVGRCIDQYWPGGVQDTRRHELCIEYKLKGYPWHSNGDDAINSRSLMTHILQSLVAVGWAVMSALDISRRADDKAVFVLRSCTPASVPHFCINPSKTDRIRLINAPKNVQNAVSGVIHSNWYGVQSEGVQSLMAYEWKLKGEPWSSYGGNDYAMSRHLMTRLLNELARLGWRVICSADMSAKYDNAAVHADDVHCWFVARTGLDIQLVEAAGNSSVIGFRMPSAPSPSSSEPITPPPSYREVMNEKN